MADETQAGEVAPVAPPITHEVLAASVAGLPGVISIAIEHGEVVVRAHRDSVPALMTALEAGLAGASLDVQGTPDRSDE